MQWLKILVEELITAPAMTALPRPRLISLGKTAFGWIAFIKVKLGTFFNISSQTLYLNAFSPIPIIPPSISCSSTSF